jgi:hypothetical protein
MCHPGMAASVGPFDLMEWETGSAVCQEGIHLGDGLVASRKCTACMPTSWAATMLALESSRKTTSSGRTPSRWEVLSGVHLANADLTRAQLHRRT